MNDYHTIGMAKKYWTPIFEEFKFAGSFEHHVHQFKRTFPLDQYGKPKTGGTV
jgi:hypothetical protein